MSKQINKQPNEQADELNGRKILPFLASEWMATLSLIGESNDEHFLLWLSTDWLSVQGTSDSPSRTLIYLFWALLKEDTDQQWAYKNDQVKNWKWWSITQTACIWVKYAKHAADISIWEALANFVSIMFTFEWRLGRFKAFEALEVNNNSNNSSKSNNNNDNDNENDNRISNDDNFCTFVAKRHHLMLNYGPSKS